MNRDTRQTPRWIGDEYGWDFIWQADFCMLAKNMAAVQNIMANPTKFPKVNIERVYARWELLHDFLAIEAPTEYLVTGEAGI